jgi:hypothetical protein
MTAYISDDARTLLRAAYDIHAESGAKDPSQTFRGGITLDMPGAGRRARMPLGSERYSIAVWELEREQIIAHAKPPAKLARHRGRGTEYILSPSGAGREILGL